MRLAQGIETGNARKLYLLNIQIMDSADLKMDHQNVNIWVFPDNDGWRSISRMYLSEYSKTLWEKQNALTYGD